MIFINIRLIFAVLTELLSVILPFIMAFRREWRFSAAKTTGILAGYLFFMCLLTTACPRFPWNRIYLSWICFSMAANVLVCKGLTRTGWKVIVYTSFLFKNFADAAVLLALLFSLTQGRSCTPECMFNMTLSLLLLLILVGGAYFLLHEYLPDGAEYTRSLPVWSGLATVPVLLFFVFHFDIGRLVPDRFLEEHPYAFLSALSWLGCIYMIHFVSLKTLARLNQSYANTEQYRTARLLTSVQTSQMATLQHNLDQLKKTRHDYRHHLITLKGLVERKENRQVLNYINEYLGSSPALPLVEYCSNTSSNAILNYYIQLARDQGIDVEASISLPSPLPLPDIDFCTILGNLLSNAVEACMRQTSGPASITIRMGQPGKSMVALSIRNTYTHSIRLKDGCFMSSKREDPGTGTASVRYLAERYHGILNYTYKDGIFEASLLLNPHTR